MKKKNGPKGGIAKRKNFRNIPETAQNKERKGREIEISAKRTTRNRYPNWGPFLGLDRKSYHLQCKAVPKREDRVSSYVEKNYRVVGFKKKCGKTGGSIVSNNSKAITVE